MTKEKRNRLIHLTGLLLCLMAFALSIGPVNAKTILALAIAAIGVVGNAYGVLRPLSLLR